MQHLLTNQRAMFWVFSIQFQVLELQLKAEKLVDRAVELTTGNESRLTKLIQSGDVSRAVQLAKAAIVAVDEDKKAQPVTKELLKEKRKEVIDKYAASVY